MGLFTKLTKATLLHMQIMGHSPKDHGMAHISMKVPASHTMTMSWLPLRP